MDHYQAKTFKIPELEGISDKQMEEHMKLYHGYVKHSNAILEKVSELKAAGGDQIYTISELRRRFAFEFDGMRSHEYYFGALEGGARPLTTEGWVGNALNTQYGDVEKWITEFKEITMTRGSGWAILHYDPDYQEFVSSWVDEHHLGHLSSLPIVLAVDCWEHAYMIDYLPGERATYVDAYLSNVNWDNVDKWFRAVSQK